MQQEDRLPAPTAEEKRAEDVQVAMTQHKLGQCMREAGRPGEAAECFQRALEIEEAKLGQSDPQVAVTLYKLGQCIREAGKPVKAIQLFERALAIEEAKTHPDDVQVSGVVFTGWWWYVLGRRDLSRAAPFFN